jgi:hypothetical protein
MNCSVCSHPDRQAIDQALMHGVTLAALSKQYNLSTSALHRHKAHLQARVGRAKAKLTDYLHQNCQFWLSQMLEMTLRTAQAAEAEGNYRLVIQAASQGSRLITLIHKHDMPLDNRLVYKIITSPQWVTQGSIWPDDPEIMSDQRQVMAEAFTVPCPDADPDPRPAASPEDLAALQELIATLDAPILPAENRPAAPREKSGKLPGKSAGQKKKGQKNQRPILTDKMFQKDGQTCAKNWAADLAEARLEIAALTAIGAGRPAPELLPEFLAAVEATSGVSGLFAG